jgi:pimeloyl-ACP methyl ester carboxylesterase
MASLLALIGWSVDERVPGIVAPTLAVSGDRDYTPVDLKRQWAARMPHAEVAVIADSGHATPVDQPRAFNDVLLAFLARQPG